MKRIKDMVAEANAMVDHAPATAYLDQHGAEGVTFVDLRDPRELDREGMIPGAFHCPRGMLEFSTRLLGAEGFLYGGALLELLDGETPCDCGT